MRNKGLLGRSAYLCRLSSASCMFGAVKYEREIVTGVDTFLVFRGVARGGGATVAMVPP